MIVYSVLLIIIYEAEKLSLESVKYLYLEKILFKSKERYIIIGNRYSFVFSTSEKEKKNCAVDVIVMPKLTILLNECEKENMFPYFGLGAAT